MAQGLPLPEPPRAPLPEDEELLRRTVWVCDLPNGCPAATLRAFAQTRLQQEGQGTPPPPHPFPVSILGTPSIYTGIHVDYADLCMNPGHVAVGDVSLSQSPGSAVVEMPNAIAAHALCLALDGAWGLPHPDADRPLIALPERVARRRRCELPTWFRTRAA